MRMRNTNLLCQVWQGGKKIAFLPNDKEKLGYELAHCINDIFTEHKMVAVCKLSLNNGTRTKRIKAFY